MNYNIYAIIIEEQIINLIVAENIFIAKDAAKAYDKERADAVECTDYKCSIGDYYIDGFFYYKDKTTQIPNTSIDARLAAIMNANESLTKDFKTIKNNYDNVESNISGLTQNNSSLEEALCELAAMIQTNTEIITEELTGTQIAIAELYEHLAGSGEVIEEEE